MQKSGASKKGIIALAAVALLLIAALGIFAFFLLNKGKTEGNGSDATVSTEPEATSEAEAPETQAPTEATEAPAETTVNIADFIGSWHISDANDKELTIDGSADPSNICFSLWYRGAAYTELVFAPLTGNEAEFSGTAIADWQSFKDRDSWQNSVSASSTVTGKLAFEDSSITVTIFDSAFSGIPAETLVFDSRHDGNWALENYNGWYTATLTPSKATPYLVKILSPSLPYYNAPSYDAKIAGRITDHGTYTIVEEVYDENWEIWGKLKSGAGWINLRQASDASAVG